MKIPSKLQPITKSVQVRFLRLQKHIQAAPLRVKEVTTRFRGLLTSNVANSKRKINSILNLIAPTYSDVRIMLPISSVLCYALVLTGLTLTTYFVSSQSQYRHILHPPAGNEAVIGSITILLALFVPLAIALIEDVRNDALARQVVLKDILRFRFLPPIVLLTAIHIFIPLNWVFAGESFTGKTLSAVFVLVSVLFLFGVFERSYKWLTDGSDDSAGSSKEPDNTALPVTSTSYRFAMIVRRLSRDKSSERWVLILQRRHKREREFRLHEAFFTRQKSHLMRLSRKNAVKLSRELNAYNQTITNRYLKFFEIRDTGTEQFMILYALISNAIETNRRTRMVPQLRLARTAVHRIVTEYVSRILQRRDDDNIGETDVIITSADKYISLNEKLKPGLRRLNFRDTLIAYIYQQFIEKVGSKRLNKHELDGYLEQSTYWALTYENLFVTSHPVAITGINVFNDWIFDAYQSVSEGEAPAEINDVFEMLFPSANTIVLADLYWFIHLNRGVEDSAQAIQNFISSPQTVTIYASGFEGDYVDESTFRRNVRTQEIQANREAAKIILGLFGRFFFSQLNMETLLKQIDIGYDGFDNSDELNFQRKKIKARLELLTQLRAEQQ